MIEVVNRGGDEALERLTSFALRLRGRLAALMPRLGADLQSRVLDNLRGGVLHERGGRLADSLALDVETEGERASSALRVDVASVPYAGFQEYGFQGNETVRGHLRTIRQAFGRPIAERQILVNSYTRKVEYPAHSFLRSALRELTPSITPQIEDAVTATASGS